MQGFLWALIDYKGHLRIPTDLSGISWGSQGGKETPSDSNAIHIKTQRIFEEFQELQGFSEALGITRDSKGILETPRDS